MRKARVILFFLVAAIASSTIAVSAQNYASSGKFRSLDEQIYRRLKGLPNANVFDHIAWQVNGGTVILTGKVLTLGTRSAAKDLVRDLPGVTQVVNNIQELPPSAFDDEIRGNALAIFTSRGPAQYFGHPNPDVRIIVENGRLTLEGYVTRESDSNTLNVLANSIGGVFKVTNNLIVGDRKF